MYAFEQIENLQLSWINNHQFSKDNYNNNFINDDFIKIIDSIINICYFDNNLNMKFNFQINTSDFDQYYLDCFEYAIFALHKIDKNYYNNNNNDIFVFQYIWDTIINNYNNSGKINNEIIHDNIIKYIRNKSEANFNQFIRANNFYQLFELYKNNYNENDYNKINNSIIKIKTSIISNTNIINRTILKEFKSYNNWYNNSYEVKRLSHSYNKYKFKEIIKINNNNISKDIINTEELISLWDNYKYNKIFKENLDIDKKDIDLISNHTNYNKKTILRWIRNSFANDITDIDYYLKYEFSVGKSYNKTINRIGRKVKTFKLTNNPKRQLNFNLGKLNFDAKNNDNESRSNFHFRSQNIIKNDKKLSYSFNFADQNDI